MKNTHNRLLAAIVTVGLLMMSFASCVNTAGTDSSDPSEQADTNEKKPLKIISSVFPGYDFATQICGDNAEVSVLVPLGMNTHAYEPTPQDIVAIQNCDLFIYVGEESESWVNDILDAIGKPVPTFVLSDHVPLLPVTTDDHDHDEDQDDHDDDDHTHTYDDHVWTSPQNAARLVRALETRLIEINPEQQSSYQQNAAAYSEKLMELDQQFVEFFNTVENKTMVIGDQFSLRYFAHEYGLTVHAAFVGCATDSEISPAILKNLIAKMKEEQLSTVFHMEFSSPKIAETIAEPVGANVARLHSAHNISKEERDQGVTYVSLFQGNLAVLKEAMG